MSYSTTTNAINLLEPNSKQAIKFCIGEEVMLSLTEDGFYYQGRVINDEGEAIAFSLNGCKTLKNSNGLLWKTELKTN